MYYHSLDQAFVVVVVVVVVVKWQTYVFRTVIDMWIYVQYDPREGGGDSIVTSQIQSLLKKYC